MTSEKQLRSIRISPDQEEVKITFEVITTKEMIEGEDENQTKAHKHSIVGKLRPHKDLTDLMKKLRKYALAINEIEVDSKDIGKWTVQAISITGDYIFKKSRCVMTLAKEVKRTGKVAVMKTSQVTMYPQMDEENRFEDAEKMSEIIEAVIEESWLYLNGKSEDDDNQLQLFPTEPKLETNFTK